MDDAMKLGDREVICQFEPSRNSQLSLAAAFGCLDANEKPNAVIAAGVQSQQPILKEMSQ